MNKNLPRSRSTRPSEQRLVSKVNQSVEVSRNGNNSYYESDNENKKEVKELANVTDELRSKRRLLQQVDKQLTGVPLNMQGEVLKRDAFINQLNQNIIELKAAQKENVRMRVKDDEIEKLTIENSNLIRETQRWNDDVRAANEELQEAQEAFFKDKEDLELMTEALTEEIEETKAQADLKEKLLAEAKQDMAHLAKIVQDMTQLNNDLNQKVTSMNNEMEQLNSEVFKHKAKASHSEELEKLLAAATKENVSLERHVAKVTQMIEVFKKAQEETFSCYRRNEENFKDLERELIQTGNEKLSEQLTTLRHEFKLTAGKEMGDIAVGTRVKNAKKVGALKAELQQKEIYVQKVAAEEKLLKDRIKELKRTVESFKAENQDSQRRLMVRANRLNEENERLREKAEQLNTELTKRHTAASRAENTVSVNLDRIDKLKKKNVELTQKTGIQETAIKDLKNNILKLQTDRVARDREFTARERRIRKAAAMAKSQEEELYNRDTQILKREGIIQKLSTEIESYRRSPRPPAQTKVPNRIDNDMKIANRHIADLEGEIVLLKEMIRSQQTQVKAAEKDMMAVRKYTMVSGSPEPPNMNKKAQDPLFAMINGFVQQAAELHRWKEDRRSRFMSMLKKGSTLPIQDIREVLQFAYPGSGDMNPIECLEKSYKNKASKLHSDLIKNFRGVKRRLSITSIREGVRSQQLDDLLVGRSEIAVADLAMILQQLL